MSLDPQISSKFSQACGEQAILTDQSDCWAYGIDHSKQHACPDLVVLPQHIEQIQQCIQICNEYKLPLTTRGRGTGTTGAAVPIHAGIVLSTERMKQILQFDTANRTMRVQAGVLNASVQQAAAEKNLFWPPDPSSAEYCSVGGNLACNAAGPRAVKYGTCRENTLSLSAVTGAGEIIHTGSATTKGVVGLDLTRLLIGSEGILAVITEALLKLSPIAERTDTIRALYSDANAAIQAVVDILGQNALPCALEFIDEGSLNLIRTHSDLDLDNNAKAMLMIEVDGLLNNVDSAVAAISHAANNASCLNIKNASNKQAKKELWSARKTLSPALRSFAPNKINEDVVVPVSELPNLLKDLSSISSKHNIPIFSFGHAGNGKLHVNLLYDGNDSKQASAATKCLADVFDSVLRLNGTLSGEHGIGIAKRDFVKKEIGDSELILMQNIKQQFDPNSILNPGKTLPSI